MFDEKVCGGEARHSNRFHRADLALAALSMDARRMVRRH